MNETVVDLLAGNARHAQQFADRFDDVQDAQHPVAVTVCCSDSRVLQDQMWGNEQPGHLFTVGNIGNRVVQLGAAGEEVADDVLYPIAHTGTETAVVVGHTGCGAVTGAYRALAEAGSEPAGIEHSLRLLAPHLEAGVAALPDGLDTAEAVNRLVEYNVDQQVASLVESERVPDALDVVGAVYDFQDVYGGERGEIHVVNVGGVRRVDALRDAHPEVADRIDRVWEY
ncbi:carbonic anhydrase [Halosimplex carlsbadense 2-9-1]|uniref:carbonic anhydrase n=1 Tax=Halosimplex carlsbadense 2-9-1 TaxID=797114 RepID=M0CLZ6_9EURY|nr:carbonic anhydrase [Halosimplex carlsbadense]ELZ24295.1 carbonic anhydrase [Halosimplex carlsbadense 2-9-1]